MGKFDGYLFCSDCDGTLTDYNHVVSKANKDAIRYFQSEGGLFTLATGRYPAYIADFAADFIPNAPIVASNGSLLYDLQKEKVVKAIPLAGNFEQVLTFAFHSLPTIQEFCFSGPTDSLGAYYRQEMAEDFQHNPLFGEYLPAYSAEQMLGKVRGQTLLRMFFVQEKEHTQYNYSTLKEKFKDEFTFMAGWECGLECLPKNCGKGEMISELKKLLGESVHTVVCVGDYDNDRSMLKMADISYAVENAPAYVKAGASRTTVSCNHSAIAAIIAELDKNHEMGGQADFIPVY